jgi:alanine dehydrogenase
VCRARLPPAAVIRRSSERTAWAPIHYILYLCEKVINAVIYESKKVIQGSNVTNRRRCSPGFAGRLDDGGRAEGESGRRRGF